MDVRRLEHVGEDIVVISPDGTGILGGSDLRWELLETTHGLDVLGLLGIRQ